MSDCFVLYLLLTCMKKKTSGADKFTNNSRCWMVTFQIANMENLELAVAVLIFIQVIRLGL